MNFIEHLRADEGNTAGSHSAMVRNAYLVANYASETSLVHEQIKSNQYIPRPPSTSPICRFYGQSPYIFETHWQELYCLDPTLDKISNLYLNKSF